MLSSPLYFSLPLPTSPLTTLRTTPFNHSYHAHAHHDHHSMTTLLEPKTTLAYLAYLGYPTEPRTSALHITRPRSQDRRKGKSTRNVFLCYVCGAAGSGKTSLLRAFAGKGFLDSSSSSSNSAASSGDRRLGAGGAYEPTKKMMSVVNSVDIEGEEKIPRPSRVREPVRGGGVEGFDDDDG